MTSGTYDHSDEPNTRRVPGTMVGTRNFGTLEVEGPRKERVMTIRTHSANGDVIWERVYKASDL